MEGEAGTEANPRWKPRKEMTLKFPSFSFQAPHFVPYSLYVGVPPGGGGGGEHAHVGHIKSTRKNASYVLNQVNFALGVDFDSCLQFYKRR